MKKSPYDSVIFAGGGNRCFWQAGFWSTVAGEMHIRPSLVVGASAGAAVACLIFSGRLSECMELFKEMTGRNPKNAYLSNIFSDRPVFPHEAMYRRAVLDALDEEAFARLKKGPELRIVISRLPGWAGPRIAAVAGILTYTLEKHVTGRVHPRWGRKMGFVPETVTVRECATTHDLADLLLSSSSTPPFTPVMKWKGAYALDGGFVDNVPAYAASDNGGRTLVLLTRKYGEEAIPSDPACTYVMPSKPIEINKWDYTNPKGVQDAFDLGRMDGEGFLKRDGDAAAG